MGTVIPIIFVFIGCCSNVIFLELLIKDEPSSGNIITCAQFVFIAIHGFIFTMNFGQKSNVIPIKEYLVLVVMFFIVNVTNNLAFGYKISMPLHMIFRSGGLIANMIMAIIVLNRHYSVMKYTSVGMITLGTALCTYASAGQMDYEKGNSEMSPTFQTWLMGLGLLTFALFMSARMGIFQECLYSKHGKHPREALFFIHLMSLPGFIMTVPSIIEHVVKFSSSAPLPQLIAVPLLSSIPRLWLYLIGNMVTQFVCISSVFALTSECTSLTVTLVLTLRKFISLLFSIVYFQNPFTVSHWMGTILVFGGTLLFAEVIDRIRNVLTPKVDKIE